MTLREPRWDLDVEIGAQSELWVGSIRDLLAKRNGEIEVKAPKPFLASGSFYVEYLCWSRRMNDWVASGLQTTKAKAWVFTFGALPGGLIVDTDWLRRAARLAYRNSSNRRACERGDNPTRGVVVSLNHLWQTRDREP